MQCLHGCARGVVASDPRTESAIAATLSPSTEPRRSAVSRRRPCERPLALILPLRGRPLKDTYAESDVDATFPGFPHRCGGRAEVRGLHGRKRAGAAWPVHRHDVESLAFGACGICAAAVA